MNERFVFVVDVSRETRVHNSPNTVTRLLIRQSEEALEISGAIGRVTPDFWQVSL